MKTVNKWRLLLAAVLVTQGLVSCENGALAGLTLSVGPDGGAAITYTIPAPKPPKGKVIEVEATK